MPRTIILNLEEEAEIIRLKSKLSSLRKNERFIYYTGATPHGGASNLIQAKLKTVDRAYLEKLIVPAQRAVGEELIDGRLLNIFEYIAIGI